MKDLLFLIFIKKLMMPYVELNIDAYKEITGGIEMKLEKENEKKEIEKKELIKPTLKENCHINEVKAYDTGESPMGYHGFNF